MYTSLNLKMRLASIPMPQNYKKTCVHVFYHLQIIASIHQSLKTTPRKIMILPFAKIFLCRHIKAGFQCDTMGEIKQQKKEWWKDSRHAKSTIWNCNQVLSPSFQLLGVQKIHSPLALHHHQNIQNIQSDLAVLLLQWSYQHKQDGTWYKGNSKN